MPYSEAIKCKYGVFDHYGKPASKYASVGLYLKYLAPCSGLQHRVETKILVTRELPNIVQRHHILHNLYKNHNIFGSGREGDYFLSYLRHWYHAVCIMASKNDSCAPNRIKIASAYLYLQSVYIPTIESPSSTVLLCRFFDFPLFLPRYVTV